jgi:holo-[acyl-carrier protein] synthase
VSAGGGAAVGVDLLEIGRLERALERHPRLAERVFTSAELEYARKRRRPGRHLAARFAAKEAAVKALGVGPLGLGEVEVVAGTPPRLRLAGAADRAATAAALELEVSLSHSRETAVAVVIAVPQAR